MKSTDTLGRLFNILRNLDNLIPDKEGAVSLTLYADLSWEMILNMWGAAVASCSCNNEFFIIDMLAVRDSNPHWLPEVELIVASLNKEIVKHEH